MSNRLAEKEQCNACHTCFALCPSNAISMIADSKGFLYPKIDNEKCIDCGRCHKNCPVLSRQNVKESKSETTKEFPYGYAAYNKDLKIRLKSSSGGIFHLLARQIIEEDGGVIVAPAFDKNLKLKHVCIDKSKDIERLLGSKYLQSEIGSVYKKVKYYLEQSKTVLFSGTPCQIGGLYYYLQKKDYPNLYYQDIVCHGVPSPKVFHDYIREQERNKHKKAKSVSFRNKEKGWMKFSFKIEYQNGKTYTKEANKDRYMRSFLQNYCLRPSCYNCAFKGIERLSDITLADFWGIDNIFPKLNDDKGISLIIIHSAKGKELFEKITSGLVYHETDVQKAVVYNSAATKSVEENPNNKQFVNIMEDQENGVMVALNKFCRYDYLKNVIIIFKEKIKVVLRKFGLYHR